MCNKEVHVDVYFTKFDIAVILYHNVYMILYLWGSTMFCDYFCLCHYCECSTNIINYKQKCHLFGNFESRLESNLATLSPLRLILFSM